MTLALALLGWASAQEPDATAAGDPEVPTDEAPPESTDAAWEIVVEARRPSPNVTRQILDRERVEQVPGTHDDPFRLIQSLPGVAITPEYSPSAGDIAIRGSTPGESRIYVDGVEVPYLYHFQQYASVLHTRLLDEVAVYPSTFSAAYGDAIGGVVWAKTRDADLDAPSDAPAAAPEGEESAGRHPGPDPNAARLRAGGNINFIMGGGFLQTAAGDSGAISASGRRSYLDLVEDSNDQYTLWPVFWDYMTRYERELSPDHRVALTAFGAGDSYARFAGDSALLDPLEQESNPSFAYDRSFHAVSARSQDTFGRASLDTIAAAVADQWSGDLPEASADRQELYASLRSAAEVYLREGLSLSTGVDLKATHLSRFAETDRSWLEVAAESPMLARGVSVDETLTRLSGGAWLEPRLGLGRTQLQPGGRLQFDTASETWALEPRLTMQSEPLDDLRLRAAAGRYSQAPELDALSPLAGDPTLGRIVSDQVAGGVDLAVAGRWEIAVDGWGKRIQDAVLLEPGEAPVAVDGQAWGAELTSRYRLRERFFTWASFAVGRAERGGVPFDYDQPWSFNYVASLDFREHWNVGLRYRYAAGLPLTPITAGLYDGDSDAYLPVYGETNSDRTPDYQKVDLHLEREVLIRRWRAVGYLEAWYVPPSGNVLYPAYSYDYSQRAWVAGPGFVPLLGLRVETAR